MLPTELYPALAGTTAFPSGSIPLSLTFPFPLGSVLINIHSSRSLDTQQLKQ